MSPLVDSIGEVELALGTGVDANAAAFTFFYQNLDEAPWRDGPLRSFRSGFCLRHKRCPFRELVPGTQLGTTYTRGSSWAEAVRPQYAVVSPSRAGFVYNLQQYASLRWRRPLRFALLHMPPQYRAFPVSQHSRYVIITIADQVKQICLVGVSTMPQTTAHSLRPIRNMEITSPGASAVSVRSQDRLPPAP